MFSISTFANTIIGGASTAKESKKLCEVASGGRKNSGQQTSTTVPSLSLCFAIAQMMPKSLSKWLMGWPWVFSMGALVAAIKGFHSLGWVWVSCQNVPVLIQIDSLDSGTTRRIWMPFWLHDQPNLHRRWPRCGRTMWGVLCWNLLAQYQQMTQMLLWMKLRTKPFLFGGYLFVNVWLLNVLKELELF